MFRQFDFLNPKGLFHLFYLAFQSFDYARTQWMLFHKRIVRQSQIFWKRGPQLKGEGSGGSEV
jgi:hypothetical protein